MNLKEMYISYNSTAPFTRFCKGLASTSLTQVITGLTPIILVPLFLRAWGASGYGFWLSLTAWVSFLKLFDLGGQSFIGNLINERYVHHDIMGFRRILSEGVSLFVFLCSLVLILLTLVLLIPGILPEALTWNSRLILLIMGAAFLFGIPGGIYVSLYRATGFYYVGAMFGNVYRALFLLVCITLLWASSSPTLFAGGHLAWEIISAPILVWYTGRRIPTWSRLRLSLSAAWAGRAYLKGSLYFWLIALALALNFQGTIIVLGAFTSSAAVALYATHRTVSGLVGYVGTLFQGPLWPELTFLEAQGQQEKLRRLSLLTIRTVVFLSGTAALVLWLFFPLIYPLWTGKHLEVQSALMLLLLCQAVLAAGWSTAGWSLLAANRHRGLALFSLANALLTILLALVLAPRFGVLGVAGASLAGDLVFGAAVYPYLLSRFLDISVLTIYRAMVLPLLAVALPGLFLGWLSVSVPSWQLALITGVLAILLVYPAALLALGREEVAWLFNRIQGWARNRV